MQVDQSEEGGAQMKITHIGIDIAKNVFEIHGIDERGARALSRTLKRRQLLEFFSHLEPCEIAMEACGSAHHWARELRELGHEVKLIAARFVIPYRKNDKNDRNDADAICEALTRPRMRFVSVKSPEQQAVLTLHRSRALLVKERTALINHVRGLLAEFGIPLSQGAHHVRARLPDILEDAENNLPSLARECFAELYDRLCELEQRLSGYERRFATLAREMPGVSQLMSLPGVGVLTATAVLASVGDARQFRNGRQFAAWLGLVPRQYSTGGKPRYGRITKRGDVYLRTLLIHGARSALRTVGRRDDRVAQWAQALRERRGGNKAAVALAAKNARILWAMMAHGEPYTAVPVAP
jgi:transposase